VDKKKRLTEEGRFEEFTGSADAQDAGGLTGPEDAPGLKGKEEPAASPEPWTKRGEMLPDDKGIIQGTAGKNLPAARIFVTGEVSEDYIGGIAVRHLLSINDVYYENGAGAEPLFVQTRNGTIRTARFDPAFVWRCFHPDVLVKLVRAEIDRLGIDMDPWKMDYFDFYQNMVAALKAAHGEDAVMVRRGGGVEGFYRGVYLSCLILFGKPGYMDVPAAEHFAPREAADFLKNAEAVRLNGAERIKLEALRKEYGGIRSLTNPEMHFVVDIFERALK
jgi:hypothetical protein